MSLAADMASGAAGGLAGGGVASAGESGALSGGQCRDSRHSHMDLRDCRQERLMGGRRVSTFTTTASRAVLMSAFVIGMPAAGAAQPPRDSRPYVAVKGGLNAESAEDGVSGSSGAAGLAVGFGRGGAWTFEVEFWLPDYIDLGGKTHRDTLVSAAFIRPFGTRSVRPHILVGASAGRVEERSTICFAMRQPPGSSASVRTLVPCEDDDVIDRQRDERSNGALYGVAGAGLEIPLGRRVQLVPEVRVNLAITAVILRPAVALRIAF